MRNLFASLLTVVLLHVPEPGLADVPYIFSYQGFLTDAVGNPVTGEWTITFSFFHQEAGGEAFYVDSADVSVEMGLFSAQIGDDKVNPVPYEEFETGEVYLELSIETDVGPVILSPRQRVVSNPFSLYSLRAEEAGNAATVGGKDVSTFVTVEQVGELCVTPGKLEELLLELGFTPGGGLNEEELATWLVENGFNPCTCYSDDDVAAYLLAAGYEPGPSFSGNYADLVGAPDLEPFVEEDELVDLLAQSGAVLMADGSIALAGPLDFAGFEARNLVIHQGDDPPDNPVEGQLWWDTGDKLLRIFDGEVWVILGSGDATDLACEGCVDPDDVSFPYALADSKGGVALMSATTKDVTCEGCVQASEVDFAWAKGVIPGGDAEHALSADSATSASIAENAKDVTCVGCVKLAEIDPSALASNNISYDPKGSGLGVNTVQKAIDKLALAGGSGFQEGNGTIVPYVEQWGLPAYGEATTYIHLMNPAQPKVVMYLYAGESSGFASSNNLVVAYSFAPNQYSADVSGNAGETALQVGNPSIFNTGSHILIHQTVGTGGNGTGAGNWEVNQVVSVQGTTLQLVKPLEHTYVSCGDNCGRAQAVVAASYNQLEIVNGGTLKPAKELDGQGKSGGIVYIRARRIVVKNGGKIVADGAGFEGGSYGSAGCEHGSACGYQGDSHCNTAPTSHTTSPNCSGGGGARLNACWWDGGNYCNNANSGGGGGGNKTAGEDGSAGWKKWTGAGKGGSAIPGGEEKLLFGGGGGGAYPHWCQNCRAGDGGGIIVLGAQTIIIEKGGTISANGLLGCPTPPDLCGNTNAFPIAGSGAGGTIRMFADQFVLEGDISAAGGPHHKGNHGTFGGKGGDGWIVQTAPIPGVVNESYAKGVEIWVDDVNVTGQIGDPNSKGAPAWDAENKKWGADGLSPWSTGPLDLSSIVPWTLGEHTIKLVETGGAGGDLKMFLYVIYPFSKSVAPTNDTCDQPVMLDLSKGVVTLSGTTEDIMGKTKATDANQGPFCGGSGGPDVVYAFTLDDWRTLTVDVQSAFTPRVYIKKGNCTDGDVVACGQESFVTGDLEPGTYYLFVDSDGNLQKGDFKLTVKAQPPGPPPNDKCAGAQALIFQNGVAKSNGMTLFANNDYQGGCAAEGPDVVYSFTIQPGVTKVDIKVEGDFSPVIIVAKGDCESQPIACVPMGDYSMSWPTAGTYYLFVDGKTAKDKGIFTVTVTVQ